eukprot:CAMPEP_0171069166 /NCGR_PEP_ID=MMETSP0766_2-20121228/8989_1 /TAXON_ID=439317 /ORGANISM="Gambierdiscus australes, Strain CAWD 149" /LENGTH=67 /DNA_ID=CAMNT_0011525531 /DNA_START=66 /DNA_END=270 /DNA_ORIENTATION=+
MPIKREERLDVATAKTQGLYSSLLRIRGEKAHALHSAGLRPIIFEGTTRLNTRDVISAMGLTGWTSL